MDVLVSLKHDGRLSDYLYKAYASKHLCDVEVVTSDQSTFYTHRLVLSTFSDFFQRKIKGRQDSYNMVISIDVDSAVFKVLMEFMYTGQLCVTPPERISLYHASVILEMDTAQELLQQAYISSEWPGIMNSKISKSSSESDQNVKVGQDSEVKETNILLEDNTSKGTEKSLTRSKLSDLHLKKKKRGRKKKEIKVEEDAVQQVKVTESDSRGDLELTDNQMVTRNRGKRRPVVDKKPKVRNVKESSKETGRKETKKKKKKENVTKVAAKKIIKIWVPNGAKIKCETCGKTLTSYTALKRHMVIQHKEIPLRYTQSKALLSNITKSSGAMRYCTLTDNSKKYMCTLCSCSFQYYSLFYRHTQENHMQVNQGDKQGVYYRIAKHVQNMKSIFSLKKKNKGKTTKRNRRKVSSKVYEKCCFCHSVLSKGRIYASHLIKKHYLSFEKAKELTGYPKYRLQQKWECPDCNLTFVGNKALKSHFEGVHQLDDMKYPCPECDSSYSSLGTIKSHLRWVHKRTAAEVREALKNSVTCEVEGCNYSTGNMVTMKLHVVKEHPEVEYKCTECNFTFHVKKTLNRHMIVKHLCRSEHLKKQCDTCGRRFSKNSQLHVHQFLKHGIYHDEMKLYRCEHNGCNKVCMSSSSLKSHMRRHSSDKNYECPYCSLKLKTEVTLKKHINKMHLGIRPHLCQVCGQRFGEDSELQSHIKNRHSTDKEFQCEHCPYATANKATFYTHLFMVHKVKAKEDTRKEFQCPHCEFTTLLGHRFKTHLNGHKNIREYSCNMCDKKFISSSTLRAHKQWTHSEKKYDCPHCGYQTKTSQKLNEHIRIQHQLKGFKPYRCPYCTFTCATGGNTRKHIKQKHKDLEVRYIRDDSLLEAARLARKSGNTMSLNYISVQEDVIPDTQPGFELQEFQLPPQQEPSHHGNHQIQLTATPAVVEVSNLHTLTNVAVHSDPIIDPNHHVHPSNLVPQEVMVTHENIVVNNHGNIVTLGNVHQLTEDSVGYSAAIVNAINQSMQHL
ncbi:zinc finger protein 99-like [Saccostrea echinata]|uniref:zinc finger protein 99-like n=1 Tax=Saccostrea echinata TaxID=191078 RepID=UPI002A805164|nr:zinc finger protein 99-like [Saccostrea echinata]